MKTVGIVTFFKSNNYGVWLQAYATQQFFEKYGYDVDIINYANKLENQKTRFIYKEKNRIIGYFISFIRSVIFGGYTYYKKAFGKHLKDYYKLTSIEYSNISDMKDMYYDILVAGSDQLWNPYTTYGEIDKVFLLQFGKTKTKISLSTSLGSDVIREEDRNIFINAFKSFKAISVREEFAREQLKDLTDLPIKVTVDPTFLLTRSEWLALINKKIIKQNSKKRYILTYFVSPNKRSERYRSIIKKYSDLLNLPVFAIQFSRSSSTPYNKKILGATIADFIYLLNNSTLMITDSFHGVALSLNLRKEFVAIENKENPERVKYLLNNLGLEDRINLEINCYKKINYEAVEEKIDFLREDTKNWIKSVLE